MRRLRLAVLVLTAPAVSAYDDDRAASSVRAWVDPSTPAEALAYTSSRGDKWELVMSDEFDTAGRSFVPGDDHLWTAIEAVDGEAYYTTRLATTECQDGVGCYLKLEATTTPRAVSVWNPDTSRLENTTLYYQSAMLQSWNKFCFQGGMVEVRAKLPGAVGPASKNPDLANGATARVKTAEYYPTWPGVWLMGNLGRALFRDSLDRMWPFSYNQCEPELLDPKNQRISACEANPESGMNPNQGRGAPQINVVEAHGLVVRSSMQIAPGMPPQFRRIAGETTTCAATATCQTQGANVVGVPKTAYDPRGHKSWYQGLRYASNPLCAIDASQGVQSLGAIQAALNNGIVSNTCDINHCPASFDINSDLSPIGTGSAYGSNWGINTDGSCFARMDTYDGSVQCDRLSRDAECSKAPRSSQPPAQNATSFKYRTDAVSANWPAQLSMFTEFMPYQVEWVPGDDGYIRWMLDGHPIFEIPGESVTAPPQDTGKLNPTKMLPEEPMYLIMNVALSSASNPVTTPQACNNANNANNKTAQLICEQFPMALKIDYVRVYQDVSESSSMSVGCDPASHPTKKWIQDHLREYENDANRVVDMRGKAFCAVDEDCSVSGQSVGSCKAGRCVCDDADWSGPRCTVSFSSSSSRNALQPTAKPAVNDSDAGGGGPEITLGVAIGVVLVMLFAIIAVGRQVQRCTLFRRMSPTNHNVRSFAPEPRSRMTVANYQPSPTIGYDIPKARTASSHYAAYDTPQSDQGSDRPNFVVQL